MSAQWVDIGVNLTHESFSDDQSGVIARAAAVGVTRQIVTGADLLSSKLAAGLAANHPGQIWSTAGVHPHHAVAFAATQAAELQSLLAAPQVVAVGECGLDYFRNISPPSAQRTAFVAQLEIAAAIGKPVFLHQREAHADFVAILEDFRRQLVGGVAHCFTGTNRELADYLELDLFIGMTGWVCDERRGVHLREVIPNIPANRLMLETDAPYLLPRDLRPRPTSRRNEPAYLPHIARVVAQLRGESEACLSAATTDNAVRFFGLGAPRIKDS